MDLHSQTHGLKNSPITQASTLQHKAQTIVIYEHVLHLQ